MVTVTVIKPYKDIEKSLLFYPGEAHKVTKDRADSLVKAGVVKLMDEDKVETPVKAPTRRKPKDTNSN